MANILVKFLTYIEKLVQDQIHALKTKEKDKLCTLTKPYLAFVDLIRFLLSFM